MTNSEACQAGLLAGYPVVDVSIELLDGSYHEVDSSEMAFRVAASMAFQEAFREAGPHLLEPIMSLEIITPADFMGEVIGDLTSRRGRVTQIEPRHEVQAIVCLAPLGELFGYATDLRSSTQGRATYSMQFSHYRQIPKSLNERLMGGY